MLIAFTLGYVFGFVGAMPVAGPIAALVLKRILDGRFDAARSLGAGASVADAGWAYLAFWGVTGLLQRYPMVDLVSQAVGAVILWGLGVHFVLREPREASAATEPPPSKGIKRAFLLGLTINASNPTLLATWTAAVVFVNGSGLVHLDQGHAPVFGIAAGLGMASWFLVLVWIVQRYSVRMKPQHGRAAVRGTGVLLLAIGCGFAYRFVQTLSG